MFIKQTLDFLFLQAMQALLTHLLLFAAVAAPDFGGPLLLFPLGYGLLFALPVSLGEATGRRISEAEIVGESRKMLLLPILLPLTVVDPVPIFL